MSTARAELAPFGIWVYAMFPPLIDTPMSAALSGPKMQPGDVAAAILDHLGTGTEDGYIGAAKNLHARLREDPKAVERAMAAHVSA